MKLNATDYTLLQAAQRGEWIHRLLGQMESSCLRNRLDNIQIERPVFITGLARSGTTILLEQLVRTNLFATHRYRDFPFLNTPYWWNWYLDVATAEQQPVERPHRDRIAITANSPEAFEEPIWQQFFPSIHAPNELHTLGADTQHKDFEAFFKDHLRKIMLIRKRDRYLSKGNYNVTRLEYLAELFPDAHFIIPIRHPLEHVKSLVRQQQLFTEYSKKDRRIGAYLRSAGHFEFGPQRQAIRLNKSDGDRTVSAWQNGEEHLGYAIQWSQVYRHVDDLRHRASDLASRIRILRYEDFCSQPRESLRSILSDAGLPSEPLDELNLDHISRPTRSEQPDAESAQVVWNETGLVAQLFGYREAEPLELNSSQCESSSDPHSVSTDA